MEVDNLECMRGYRVLFQSLSFAIQSSTALHIRGTNGSGKTSLLRILSGLRQPEQGSVYWNGLPISSNRTQYLENISYQGHETGLKSDLNAIENLEFSIRMQNHNSSFTIQEVLEKLEIDHVSMLPCFALSAGQRQRIALARIILSGTTLWILDEPGTALDQTGLQIFESIVTEHVQNGGMMVFTSHHDFKLESVNYEQLSLDRYAVQSPI